MDMLQVIARVQKQIVEEQIVEESPESLSSHVLRKVYQIDPRAVVPRLQDTYAVVPKRKLPQLIEAKAISGHIELASLLEEDGSIFYELRLVTTQGNSPIFKISATELRTSYLSMNEWIRETLLEKTQIFSDLDEKEFADDPDTLEKVKGVLAEIETLVTQIDSLEQNNLYSSREEDWTV